MLLVLSKSVKKTSIKTTDKWRPKVTLIIVTKRHQSRFYPKLELNSTKTGHKDFDKSLKSGTVADKEVVTRNHFSFYLQSHNSPLGTARGFYYHVIWDDCAYDEQTIQEITNDLCFVSARATKALSICAPARYADLFCNRLRCYMKPAFDGRYRPPEASDTFNSTLIADMTPEEHAALVRSYENDPAIWRIALADTRKNPWNAKLDDIMFYL